jgi:hypothetical protein
VSDATQITIFSQHDSPRLRYILDWILTGRFGLQYRLVSSSRELSEAQGAKINYSGGPVADSLQIIPSGMLFSSEAITDTGRMGSWYNTTTLFASDGDIPMDIFSAAFYCISRAEEYVSAKKDSHQRFHHSSSILYKLRLLDFPVVDQWIEELRLVLKSRFPGLDFIKNEFKIQHTFDIDQAFCYKGKGFIRNAGGAFRDLIDGNITALKTRSAVLGGKKRDPFDTFGYIASQGKETLVFLLLSGYGKYDKNIGPSNKEFAERIKLLMENISLGIHPSYYSKNNMSALRKEIQRLEQITGNKVNISRQHYLRFDLPATYRNLMDCGITGEYSMGYASSAGFRAGTSFSFPWFDLAKNEATTLMVHPSCIMDVTLKNSLKLTPENAKQKIGKLMDEVKKVNGTFTSIWHNESVSDYGEWKGWRDVFETIS